MERSDANFAGSIPEIYDRYLVPLIFEPYANDLADRVAKLEPSDALELAAGTGALTRAMAARLPGSARLVATDLNQPMLDYAATRLASDRRITWRQADAQALPLDDGRFGVVACQFGAMFFPDKAKAYGEARRVLRPDGTFLFNVWGRLADNEFTDVVTQALAALYPADPPRFMARTPHGYHDADVIRDALRSAGFAQVSVDVVERKSIAATPRDAAIGICQGTPLRNEIEARKGAGLDDATEAATEALAARFGNGRIEGRIRAYVITAAA